jgi:3-dehydroquinate dehydratase-1
LPTKICVSIAANKPEDIRKSIERAFYFGADYVEIRFDFLKQQSIRETLQIVEPIKERAIFTLRSVQENGKFRGSNDDRISWLQELSVCRPMLLDVELRTLLGNDQLVDFFSGSKTKILVSWHDFQKTPTNKALADIIRRMKKYSRYLKVVTTTNYVQDCIRLLDLYDVTTELNLIAFGMGELGVLSRILCTICGNAPFTYSSLEDPIAPGQLTLQQMRRLYDKVDLRPGKGDEGNLS